MDYNMNNIDDFRKFIENEGFRCIEIHYKLTKTILFSFMVEGDEKHVDVTFSNDADGFLGFDNANIVYGRFDCHYAYLESMLLNGQCRYIKHYRGDRVVDFSRFEK